MNTLLGRTTLIAIALASLAGCANMTQQQKDAAIGAAIGGVAGSVLTNGSTTGTLGGAAIGGIIGSGAIKR